MPGLIPTLTKTWDTSSVNISVTTNAAGLTLGRPYVRAFKDRLKALANFPAIVKGSSNGTVAAMDGVDRWAADTDLVWSQAATGVAHSWIVLEFSQINDGAGHKLQLLVDLHGNGAATANKWNLYMSPVAGFTGSSTTARPTATDEVTTIGTMDICQASAVHRLNFICSTDGTVYHFLSATGNNANTWLMIAKPSATIDAVPAVPAGWSYPWIVATCSAGSGNNLAASPVFSTYNSGTTQKYAGRHLTTTLAFGFEPEGGRSILQSGSLATAPHAVTGQAPILGFGIWSNTPGGFGRYGFIPDLYAIGDTSFSGYGTTLGADDTHRRWLPAGALLLPWTNDATVPLGS